jgi:hypothetical protein
LLKDQEAADKCLKSIHNWEDSESTYEEWFKILSKPKEPYDDKKFEGSSTLYINNYIMPNDEMVNVYYNVDTWKRPS